MTSEKIKILQYIYIVITNIGMNTLKDYIYTKYIHINQ